MNLLYFLATDWQPNISVVVFILIIVIIVAVILANSNSTKKPKSNTKSNFDTDTIEKHYEEVVEIGKAFESDTIDGIFTLDKNKYLKFYEDTELYEVPKLVLGDYTWYYSKYHKRYLKCDILEELDNDIIRYKVSNDIENELVFTKDNYEDYCFNNFSLHENIIREDEFFDYKDNSGKFIYFRIDVQPNFELLDKQIVDYYTDEYVKNANDNDDTEFVWKFDKESATEIEKNGKKYIRYILQLIHLGSEDETDLAENEYYKNEVENLFTVVHYFQNYLPNAFYYFEDEKSELFVQFAQITKTLYEVDHPFDQDKKLLSNAKSLFKNVEPSWSEDLSRVSLDITNDTKSGLKFLFDVYFKLHNLNSIEITIDSQEKEHLENSDYDIESLRFVFHKKDYDKIIERIEQFEGVIEKGKSIKFVENKIVEEKPKRSRRISQKVKDDVWRRDEGKCVECGSNENLEFDHIIPFSKGGANTYRNIQLLCESCNRSKSAKIG